MNFAIEHPAWFLACCVLLVVNAVVLWRRK